ncbi:unnamed protein product [Hyaloperonospora brassicae]|uniref:N-acetylglucosaminylphosphatidylinositol deacetylase n=1 Tax=Hyaloperonospora brassicae TaxID=162125 RepID=A0AAV0U3D8_HYABA|nr:unnamed protein product [Hyaloperonospora brassicae]
MLFDLNDEELQTRLEALKHLLLGANVLLFVAAALVFVVPFQREPNESSAPTKRALLVTAHPDDERAVREQELRACAGHIGLATPHVHVLEEPELQDGMQNHWDTSRIAAIVLDYVDKHRIDAVFTFDGYGVSGHPNHIATHCGVKQALREQSEKCSAATTPNAGAEKVVRGWALESTNIVRKYIGILDAVPSLWLTRQTEDAQQDRQFVFVFRPWWNYNAMALHQSQFVWYRRLFVVFSRYTFVNTFRPLLEVDVTDRPLAHKKTQ